MKVLILAVIVAMFAGEFDVCLGRPPDGVEVDVQTVGSIPPIPRWYSCIHPLEGNHLDQQAFEKCLESILANAPFLSGSTEVETTSKGTRIVVFNLKAPNLILDCLTFDAPAGMHDSLRDFLSRDPNVLKQGDVYDNEGDSHILELYSIFLQSKGVQGIVTRDLNLAYDHGNAELHYRLFQGPSTIPREPLPPYGKGCDVMVGNVMETNIDDSTPLPLVENYLRIRENACFSEDDLKKAEEELRSTGIFASLSVNITSDGGWRNLALIAKTNPTIIRHLQYKF